MKKQIKRILFLRPPSTAEKVIPIGLLYLASYLKKYDPEVEIKIVDFRLDETFNIRKVASTTATL